jgi:hypothetical protein
MPRNGEASWCVVALYIFQVMTSNRMRYAEHVACVGDGRARDLRER